MSKTAIIVFSDPKSGSDEALGRLFNALILTHDLAEQGKPVALIFQGTGTRWIEALAAADHPARPLFDSVRAHVAGICGGCADVFGATKSVEASQLPVDRSLKISGTGGMLPLSKYLAQGYTLVSF